MSTGAPLIAWGVFPVRRALHCRPMISIPEHLVGPLAGVGASVGWLFTSMFFAAAGKRVGATVVNVIRLFVAVILLACTNRLLTGEWAPDATNVQLMYLALSGLIGLAVGDQFLYIAFVEIGPRTTLLVMTTAPIFAALFGLASLGERLGSIEIVGVVVTLAGVAWVISERRTTRADDVPHPHHWRGILLAFGASACQAGGALLSKLGMGEGVVPVEQHIAPLGATLIRMMFGAVFVLPIYFVYRRQLVRARARGVFAQRTGTRRAGMGFIVLGAISGPFLGVWMSLQAYDSADLGVAQTMCSLSPVLILPFAHFVYRERIGVRAVLGALIAFTGVAMLMFAAAKGDAARAAPERRAAWGVQPEAVAAATEE